MRLQKEGSEADAAYILMQRIFPTVSHTFLMRNGICYKDDTVSELGIYGAYLRYMTFMTNFLGFCFIFLLIGAGLFHQIVLLALLVRC